MLVFCSKYINSFTPTIYIPYPLPTKILVSKCPTNFAITSLMETNMTKLKNKLTAIVLCAILLAMPILFLACNEFPTVGGDLSAQEVTYTYGEIGIEKHSYFPYATTSVKGNTINTLEVGEAFGPTGKLWVNDSDVVGDSRTIDYNNPWYPKLGGRDRNTGELLPNTIQTRGYDFDSIESLSPSNRHYISIDGKTYVLSSKPDHNVLQVRAKNVLMFREYNANPLATRIINKIGIGVIDNHRNTSTYLSDKLIPQMLKYFENKSLQQIEQFNINNIGDLDGLTGGTSNVESGLQVGNTLTGMLYSVKAVFNINSKLDISKLVFINQVDPDEMNSATQEQNQRTIVEALKEVYPSDTYKVLKKDELLALNAITDDISIVAVYQADDGQIIVEGGGDWSDGQRPNEYGNISLMSTFKDKQEMDAKDQFWLSDKYLADNIGWYINAIKNDKVFACDQNGNKRPNQTITIDGIDIDFSQSPNDGAFLKNDEKSKYNPGRGLQGVNFKFAMQIIAKMIMDGNGKIEFVKVSVGGNWDDLRIKDIDFSNLPGLDTASGATGDVNAKWLQYGASYATIAMRTIEIAKGLSI